MKRIELIAAALLLATPPYAATAADCKATDKIKVVVDLEVPPQQPTAGLKMMLRYPASVSLPGSGETTSVKERVSDLPSGFLASLNDQDGAISVALASGNETAGTGKIFTVEFDRCDGAAAPSAGDFHCDVEEAVQDCGAPAGDVHCSVKLP